MLYINSNYELMILFWISYLELLFFERIPYVKRFALIGRDVLPAFTAVRLSQYVILLLW